MKAQTEKAASTFSAADLAERTMHRRAVEAIIWGIPAVNYDLMFQSMVRDAKGAVNQILYWSRLGGLEESVSDAKPRHDLLHAFLQHEGCWANSD